MSISGLFSIDSWDFNSQTIFDGLDSSVYHTITKTMTPHHYAKGDHLFKEGMMPAGIFYIKSGMVKKYKLDKEGREQIIYVANKGELVGYHAVLAESGYPDSCATIMTSSVGFIAKEDFLYAVNTSLELSRRLLKTLSHEFSVLANCLSAASQRTVRERVALQLVVMREKFKKTTVEGEPVRIHLSREDLASLAGTALENLARVLTEMKNAGIIEIDRRAIVVVDVKRLVELTNV
jgi:CRP-like cAMP-binding protein